MKIAAFTKVFNYGVQLLPFTGNLQIAILLMGSLLEGAGSALVWVVYGGYIKALTKKYK